MKFAALVGLASAVTAQAGAAGVSPVGKVLQLMSDLQAKVLKEGEEAQKLYAEYSEWCEDRARNLGHEIKTGTSESEELKAKIAEEAATIESLTTKVDELAGAIATDEADLTAATHIREKEHADFVREEAELMETVDMLKRATAILERELAKGGAAMLQTRNIDNFAGVVKVLVQASALSSADASKLTAFVQSSQQAKADAEDAEEDAEAGAPAAAAYESHSGDIVEVLEGLTDKAEEQLGDIRKKETTDLHNFQMLEQSLKDELKFANKDLAEAKKGMSASAEAKATAEGDLATTEKELAADIEAKGDLHQSCMTKAEEFEAETNSRGEELKAIAEAKKVIQEATGGAEALSYGGASLLQVVAERSALASATDLANFEAVRLVRDLAHKQGAPALAQLAQRMAAMIRMGTAGTSADPFAKVKSLITDMIAKLESDAAADQTKKAYCDKELAETNEKKADKTAEIQKLSTKIDQAAATSAQLKEEVADLQAALAKLLAAQAEMDKMRRQEHEAFVKNKADMEQGLEGVKMALKILNEYYAAEGKGHTAASGAGTSIIGLLEVVESDFSKGLAGVMTSEDVSASEYERETKENEIEKATKTKDVEYKTKESASLDKTVSELTSDRTGVEAELDAVLQYLKQIEEQCIAKAETYADRTARREAEIAGLKEALQVLESETALLQRRSSRARRHGLRGVRLSA